MDFFKEFNLNGIFLLYLIVAANFIAQTFSCHLQSLLNNNMYMKHLISFLTLHFFVTLTTSEQKLTKDKSLFFKKFGVSVLLYIIFIASTRVLDIYFGVFFLLITANYLLNAYADTLDPEEHNNYIENLRKSGKYLSILSLVSLFIGLLLYTGEKKIEYKGQWNTYKFLFGVPKCKNYTDNYTYVQMAKAIFSK